jgi:hypothetical protein
MQYINLKKRVLQKFFTQDIRNSLIHNEKVLVMTLFQKFLFKNIA